VQFGNPIVGNEDLIREAIKSPDFNTDPESGTVTGWRIARDGTATFYNVTIGSTAFNIDENGNAVFSNVTADSIILDGEDLQSVLDSKSRGLIALTTLSGTSNAYNGTAIKFASIVVPNFDPTRMYAAGLSGIHFDRQADSTIDRVNVDCYMAWDADATTANTNLFGHQENNYGATGYDQNISLRHPFKDTTPSGTDLHLSFYFSCDTSNASGLRVQSTDNGRVYVEDLGPVLDYGSYDMGTGTAPVQTYTKTYSASWSGSYQADGDNRNISECYQGYYSLTNGNQYSLIGFPYATIQSDLSGATITKVEVYLNNNHFYNNSGGTAVIGTHTYSSEPGNASLSSVDEDITRSSFTYGQAKWVTVSNSIGTALKNNTAKGIALGPGPTTSTTYYGYFAGNGQSGEPQLRITYQK
jgi:hypothetical protein